MRASEAMSTQPCKDDEKLEIQFWFEFLCFISTFRYRNHHLRNLMTSRNQFTIFSNPEFEIVASKTPQLGCRHEGHGTVAGTPLGKAQSLNI